MRELTLNEKISIKGRLEKKGFNNLAALDMSEAIHRWYLAFSPTKPIGNYYK